jgi:Domain of unknown function (DUF6265)
VKTITLLMGAWLATGAGVSPLSAQAPRPAVAATLQQIAWLAGDWRGTSGPMTIEERWTDAAGGAMFAVARTLKGDRLAAFEFLRIVERAGGIVYIAQPSGRPPTEFTLTSITADSATFENPAHDFPKMIRYSRKPDGTLEAVVSDGGKKAEVFTFTRVR